MMLVTMMLALAAPDPRTLDRPRKAYASCIKGFESKSLAAKVEPAAYSAAVKAACPAEAAELARALIAFDIAMGGKRAAAIANAATDVGDYRLTSDERYRNMLGASPAPKPH